MKRGFSCALQISHDDLRQKTEIDQQAKYKKIFVPLSSYIFVPVYPDLTPLQYFVEILEQKLYC